MRIRCYWCGNACLGTLDVNYFDALIDGLFVYFCSKEHRERCKRHIRNRALPKFETD